MTMTPRSAFAPDPTAVEPDIDPAIGKAAGSGARRDLAHDRANDAGRPPGGELDWIVTGADAGQRLDKVLSLHLDLSRNRLKDLMLGGHVILNGTPCRDPSRKAKDGDSILVDVPAPVEAEPAPQPIPLVVMFEDDDLIVIDKPAGLVVHPAAGHADGTLVNALLAHCGDGLSGIGGVKRPGIVHRLDKDTSGLLVIAKNDAAHRGLAAQFADHGRTGPLVRSYQAFVWGLPERRSGTINAHLERSAANREKIAIVSRERGREAITHYRVDRSFDGASDDKGRTHTALVSLVECRLETGRTHQIRVHMASIGHPLLADATYGAGFRTKARHLCEGARAALAALGGRQALHAATLGFAHPSTGEEMLFESALPADLKALLEALQSG